MRVTDITGEDVEAARLGEELFEELVGMLLHDELRRRRLPGTVIGPGKTKAADGGRDLVVEVDDEETLEDAPVDALAWAGRTFYSCKSGHTWRTGVDNDLRISAVRGARKGTPIGAKAKRPPRDILEHVSAGYRYMVVTDQRVDHQSQGKLRKDLAEAFHFWLKDGLLPIPEAIEQQLLLIDATRIATYLRERRTRLPAKLREELGLKDAGGLESWEQWGREFADQRGLPPFVPDPQRVRVMEAIRDSVGQNRVLRIVGPPGVGKTRVVYEALLTLAEPSASVLYTSNPEHGRDAIERGWLADTKAVVLVVDEVCSTDVDRAAPKFRANATESLLLLVGTSDAEPFDLGAPGVRVFELDRLGDDASRTVVATQLGVDPDDPEPRLASVLLLSEGYPLFMVLLARALAVDGDALGHGRDETSRWEAAKRVIAGPRRDIGHDQWDRDAVIKAKCLLVVILAGHIERSWDQLWEQLGERLHEALDEPRDWQLVKQAAAFCTQRGILRRPDSGRQHRYVSPNNLVRIILNRFLGPPDGLGPRLVRHLPELRERLMEVARRVEAHPALRELARCELSELQRLDTEGSLDVLTQWIGSGDSLYRAARVLPDGAARGLASMVQCFDEDQFEAATSIRSAVRGTLAHLARRRLDAAAFAGVEAALFRLAKSEFEPWGNNATAVWQSLFLPGLSQTHRSWEERLDLLRVRIADPDHKGRVLAVGALDGAAAAVETGQGYSEGDRLDGPWPLPTLDQARSMKVEAWALLVSMTADSDGLVAEAARKSVTNDLRGAVVEGILGGVDGVCKVLVAGVGAWSRAQKTALWAEISEIRALHEVPSDGTELLTALENALRPACFGERLSNQVGDWTPGGWTDDAMQRRALDEDGDRVLIDEALRIPALLLDELGWLISDEAVRRPYFMQRVGQCDHDQVFLPYLEEHALQAGSSVLLAPYVIGMAEADPPRFDRWLDLHADDPRFDRPVVAAVVWSTIDDHRIECLRALLRRTSIPAPVLMPMGFQLERATASPWMLLDLVEDLSSSDVAVDAGFPLLAHVLAQHADGPADVRERALALSEVLVQAVVERGVQAASAERAWEDILKVLAASDRVAVVIHATVTEMLRKRGSARAERILRWLIERGHTAAVWDEVSAALDEGKGFELQWALQRLELVAAVGSRPILDWVKADESKARTVARLLTLRSAPLAPVARDLLLRFGAEGPVARELGERVLATPKVVDSVRDFHEQQRARALQWSEDPDPRVRTWAQRVIDEVERALATERFEEETRRRYA